MYLDTSRVAPLCGAVLFQHSKPVVKDGKTSGPPISMPEYGSAMWNIKWTLLHELPVRLMFPSPKKRSFIRLLQQFKTVMADFAAVCRLRCCFVSRQLELMNQELGADTELFGHQFEKLDWPLYLRQSFNATLKYL